MPKGYPRSVPGSLSGSERLQGDGGDQAPDGVVGYRAHVPAEDLSGRRRLRTISNDVINAARSAGKSAPMRLRPRRAVPSRWHGTTPRNSSRTLTWASTCPDLSEAAGGIEPPYGALQAPASLALGAGERANRGGVHGAMTRKRRVHGRPSPYAGAYGSPPRRPATRSISAMSAIPFATSPGPMGSVEACSCAVASLWFQSA
jgi:hypothetical protein